MRAEGKDYIVKDGDVMNFLFNVLIYFLFQGQNYIFQEFLFHAGFKRNGISSRKL